MLSCFYSHLLSTGRPISSLHHVFHCVFLHLFQVFHCVHFECPADPSAIAEYRRTHKDPVPPPVNTTPHIPVHDPQEDYLASNSDPEDDAQHNMLRNAGHYNPGGYGARAPGAAPVHQALLHGNQPEGQGNNHLQSAAVDRGDGFGFEPVAAGAVGGAAAAVHIGALGENNQNREDEELANNSIHSD